MALINCKECGKEISDQAVTCPNCGYPIKKVQTTQQAQQTKKVVQTKKNGTSFKDICRVILGVILLLMGLFILL